MIDGLSQCARKTISDMTLDLPLPELVDRCLSTQVGETKHLDQFGGRSAIFDVNDSDVTCRKPLFKSPTPQRLDLGFFSTFLSFSKLLCSQINHHEPSQVQYDKLKR
jgi:hypothetical protein